MKPIFLPKETRNAEQSFFCRYAEVSHTYDKFHYHKEYELLYQIENKGIRFIGDSIRRYSNGDIVLVGPNIPHYWHSDDIYYQKDSNIKAKLIVIHFLKDFAGKDFFELPEMKAAKSLLERAKNGIQILGNKAEELGPKIIDITSETKGWSRILSLISILNEMGEIEDFNLLASNGFCNSYYKNQNEEKITNLYNFMMQNHRELSLEETARHANMNISAFCRFFKSITNKTFSNALNEIRIGICCRQLINTELSISEIGYNCGYKSISYFNRQFKKIKRMTPLEYRLKYLDNRT